MGGRHMNWFWACAVSRPSGFDIAIILNHFSLRTPRAPALHGVLSAVGVGGGGDKLKVMKPIIRMRGRAAKTATRDGRIRRPYNLSSDNP